MVQFTLGFEPIPERCRTQVIEQTARELLESVGCEPLAKIVRVRWNRRMRSTAGSARFRETLISLNPRLIPFGPDEIDRTLRHELAHLLAQFRSGRKRIAPHGDEWRQACADLGIRHEARCHTLPLPRKQLARSHTYRCPECRQEIKRVRPFRRRVACLCCCRRHNAGRYHDRFRLAKVV